jgi:SAM-dependent methyltransferase
MHLLARLLNSLQQDGILTTAKNAARILADYSFDLKYGTDTMRRTEVYLLETNSANRTHAHRYEASKTRPLLKLFNKLGLPKDGIFVDIGCGKGRVLFVAAQFCFKRVVGIEFCAELCRQARNNAELFLIRHHKCSPIEVIETDATLYEFRGDENIFFFYNPFDSVVFEEVLKKLEKSSRQTPRNIWLIYNFPVHHEVVMKCNLFVQHHRYEIEGEIFHVYQHRAKE